MLYLHQQAFLPTFFMYDGWSRTRENAPLSTHLNLTADKNLAAVLLILGRF